jgi:hypothetical protein
MNIEFSQNYSNVLESCEKNNFESCLCYFKECILQNFSLEKLYELSFSSEINDKLIRPTLWKIFLNIFTPMINLYNWYIESKIKRNSYYHLKNNFKKKKKISNDPLQNVGIIK